MAGSKRKSVIIQTSINLFETRKNITVIFLPSPSSFSPKMEGMAYIDTVFYLIIITHAYTTLRPHFDASQSFYKHKIPGKNA